MMERLRLERPVVQAGMGGGLARAELAGAVSAAGGLGTVGIMVDAGAFTAELRRARELAAGGPVAANLLLPFTRRAHVEACIDAGVDAVVTFCGSAPEAVARLRGAGILVLTQVGTTAEARRALADGADGLIAQGVEAGGHLLGVEPTLAFLPKALAVAGDRPVLAAGGIATREDTAAALAAGAAAVVSGTRFLLTRECHAHPAYQQRVLDAERTVETRLFSVGWADRHRVVPNAATERWGDPRSVIALNRVLAPLLSRRPALAARAVGLQRVGVPFYGPMAPLRGMPERLLDVTPLYAGESSRAMSSVTSAAEAVAALSPLASRA
jgi:NAD(P)H-dependent flavin oxidoreductase YrpB (nitropropane dioxygenase family)